MADISSLGDVIFRALEKAGYTTKEEQLTSAEGDGNIEKIVDAIVAINNDDRFARTDAAVTTINHNADGEVVVDFTGKNLVDINLAANITSWDLSGLPDKRNQEVVFRFIQDATGGRSIADFPNVRNMDGVQFDYATDPDSVTEVTLSYRRANEYRAIGEPNI